MKISASDRHYIKKCLRGVIDTDEAQSMKTFIQHGNITTYAHVLNVVCMSYRINKTVRLHADRRSLVLGAFLHDYYLYDWHDRSAHKRLHGFRHPVDALINARRQYRLTSREENIIVSHMWPLTLTRVPRCREAVIVCLSDKIFAVYETIFKNKAMFDVRL